jgi:hypothetical protein
VGKIRWPWRVAHNRAVLAARLEQRVELGQRTRELSGWVVRGMELAQRAAALQAEADDAEAEARTLATGGRDDAVRERLAHAAGLRESARELAEPYAAARSEASSRLSRLELDLASYDLVLDRSTEDTVSRVLESSRAWVEQEPAVFGPR